MENTLWAVGVITLASIITLLVEIVFASFRKSDALIDGIAERLTCVEELLKQLRVRGPGECVHPDDGRAAGDDRHLANAADPAPLGF